MATARCGRFCQRDGPQLGPASRTTATTLSMCTGRSKFRGPDCPPIPFQLTVAATDQSKDTRRAQGIGTPFRVLQLISSGGGQLERDRRKIRATEFALPVHIDNVVRVVLLAHQVAVHLVEKSAATAR